MLKINFRRLFHKATPVEKIIGYTFRNPQLLDQALTHRSAAHNGRSYERLEFLGDAVLGVVIAEFLFTRHRDKNEGEMTAIRAEMVRGSTLARIGEHLSLANYIKIDKSVNLKDRATLERILASAFEALLGAIYLDSGLEPAKRLLQRQFAVFQATKRGWEDSNYKGRLYEYCQKNGKTLPAFRVLKAFGPEHAKTYRVAVFIEGRIMGVGSASQKRAAEQIAAQRALQRLTLGQRQPRPVKN